MHALPGTERGDQLAGHPVVGASWEGWVIEIERALSISLTKGFHVAREDLQPARTLVVHAGADDYPIGNGLEAVSVAGLLDRLRADRRLVKRCYRPRSLSPG